MIRKTLLIAFILTGIVIVILCISPFYIINSDNTDNSMFMHDNTTFNAKTPEEKAIFVARLNEGIIGFEWDTIINASLTFDGKYWIVNMHEAGYDDWTVTVDAETWMSKQNGSTEPKNTWRSFDELKAGYIAELQSGANGGQGRPYKVTIDGKEIWKVPAYYYHENDPKQVKYIYVDLATGKSKIVDPKQVQKYEGHLKN